MTHVFIQITKPTGGHWNYDSCPLEGKRSETSLWSHKWAEGRGWAGWMVKNLPFPTDSHHWFLLTLTTITLQIIYNPLMRMTLGCQVVQKQLEMNQRPSYKDKASLMIIIENYYFPQPGNPKTVQESVTSDQKMLICVVLRATSSNVYCLI